jgi:type II secretory pathway component PulF
VAQFSYKAVSDSGEMLQGRMEALSVDDVIGRLQDQGHTLLAALVPALTIVMTVMVAIIMAAILLPLLSLTSNIQ